MLDKKLADAMSEKYGVPMEDVLLIGLNYLTTRSDMPYRRVRFKLRLGGEEEFFLGVPITSGESPFYLSQRDQRLLLDGEPVGSIREAENDTCDTSYLRKQGRVLTLNSNSRGSCTGCAFCGTVSQNKNDTEPMDTEIKLTEFVERLYGDRETYRRVRPHLDGNFPEDGKPDLSHLEQVAVLTGCFGSEKRTVDHIRMVNDVFSRYGFDGEVFYVGCEVASEGALDTLAREVRNFALCLSLECFTRREKLMKEVKSRIMLGDAQRILDATTVRGFPANFNYVMGLDPFDEMKEGFETMASHVSRFPVVNVFQPHSQEQERLRAAEASDVEYYLRARKAIESMFMDSTLRPRPWENYRPLWYVKFGDEAIKDIRI
ncbi:MAG: hypothetical protein ABIH90_00510 [Candidatus Aenigmatarchaeota archaeon]